MSSSAPLSRSHERLLFDRRLFRAIAIAFPLVVLAGFGRTYYLKPLFDTPPLPSTLVQLHALCMTTWVLLFVVQVRLIATRQVRLHQRLGYASVALVALIVVTAIPVALRAAKYGSASTPAGVAPLSFLAVPIFDTLMLAVLFGAAVYYRRQPLAHKSLMLLAVVNLLPPALGRIPVAPLQALGPVWFFGVPTAIAAGCLILQARRYGSVSRVFLAGTALLIASYVIRLAVMTTGPWLVFATWATSFV